MAREKLAPARDDPAVIAPNFTQADDYTGEPILRHPRARQTRGKCALDPSVTVSERIQVEPVEEPALTFSGALYPRPEVQGFTSPVLVLPSVALPCANVWRP